MPEPPDIKMAFEQYKLAVEMWDRVRARRQISNSFYLSINSAILVAAAAANPPFLPGVLCAAGVLICILWFTTILNYRSLTDDKYRAIEELELQFPERPFTSESADTGSYRRHFTWVERGVAIVFALLYASVFFFHPAPLPLAHLPLPG